VRAVKAHNGTGFSFRPAPQQRHKTCIHHGGSVTISNQSSGCMPPLFSACSSVRTRCASSKPDVLETMDRTASASGAAGDQSGTAGDGSGSSCPSFGHHGVWPLTGVSRTNSHPSWHPQVRKSPNYRLQRRDPRQPMQTVGAGPCSRRGLDTMAAPCRMSPFLMPPSPSPPADRVGSTHLAKGALGDAFDHATRRTEAHTWGEHHRACCSVQCSVASSLVAVLLFPDSVVYSPTLPTHTPPRLIRYTVSQPDYDPDRSRTLSGQKRGVRQRVEPLPPADGAKPASPPAPRKHRTGGHRKRYTVRVSRLEPPRAGWVSDTSLSKPLQASLRHPDASVTATRPHKAHHSHRGRRERRASSVDGGSASRRHANSTNAQGAAGGDAAAQADSAELMAHVEQQEKKLQQLRKQLARERRATAAIRQVMEAEKKQKEQVRRAQVC